MPVGLGKVVIRRCISTAFGRDAGNVSGEWGEVPKRNVRARGPSRPRGSVAKGISVMPTLLSIASHIDKDRKVVTNL